MQFWGVNAAIFFAYSLILNKFNKKEIYLWISFIHLCSLAALRGIRIGTDTFRYSSDYLRISKNIFGGSVTIPKSSLMHRYFSFVSIFFPGRNGYMITTSIPTISAVFLLIKKYSKNYFYSIYLYLGFYLYFFSMNAGRQFFAISLSIVAFILLREKKLLLSLVFYLFAVLMHSSTIIFGAYYIIHMIEWNMALFISYSACATAASLSIGFFLRLFLFVFPRYKWMVKTSFLYEWSSNGRTSVLLALYCVTAIVLSLYWMAVSEGRFVFTIGDRRICGKRVLNKDSIAFMYELMALLVIVVVINGFHPTVILFTRLTYTLFIYILVLLSNAIDNFGKLGKYIAIVLFAPLFVFMYLQLKGNYSDVLNYTFYQLW